MVLESGKIDQVGIDRLRARLGNFNRPRQYGVGDDGFLRKMYVELRRFNVVGDTTWCKGKITGKREEAGEKLVEMDVWGENRRGEVTMKGTATVRLPSKSAQMTG